MSHFTVAVISKTPQDIATLLAPYQENNMGDCPSEYLKYFDLEEEHREEYGTGSFKKIKNRITGEEFGYYDERFYKTGENGKRERSLPDDCFEFLALHKEEYPTYQKFLEEYHGYKPDENGRYGYWENSNAKWDYWRVGGRWRGSLKARKGTKGELAWELARDGNFLEAPGYYDCAQIKDIDFSIDQNAYDNAIRFWEVCVEGSPIAENENKEDFRSFYKPGYYLEMYGDKDTYAKDASGFSTWAFISPDGKWHEKGHMGWWASNDATGESYKTFMEALNAVVSETDQEHFITIVDCHI